MLNLPLEVQVQIVVSTKNIHTAARCRLVCKTLKNTVDTERNIAWGFKLCATFGQNSRWPDDDYSWREIFMGELEMCIALKQLNRTYDHIRTEPLTEEEAWSWSVDEFLTELGKRTRSECHSRWHWAAMEGHYQFMKHLIAHNIPWHNDVMMWTLQHGINADEDGVLLLWHAGIYRNEFISPPRRFEAYLFRAVCKHYLKFSKLLLEAGANPNHEVDAEGHYLSTAVWKNDVEMVQLLLEHGADVNGFDWMDPPITSVRSAAVLKILLQAGATDNFDYDGKSLLMIATEKNDVEIVKLLLTQKQVCGPEKALKIALENNYEELIELLKEYEESAADALLRLGK